MVNLAIIATHPIQYFIPLYKKLSNELEINLTVHFLDRKGLDVYFDPGYQQELRWDIPLLEGYQSFFIKNYGKPHWPLPLRYINPQVIRTILSKDYDVFLIHGYEHISNWLVFITAILSKRPLMLRGTANLLGPKPFFKEFLKKILIGFLVRTSCAVLYEGKANRDYYEHYGVDKSKLFFTPHAVDNERFSTSEEESMVLRRDFRKEYSIPDDAIVFLYAGRFVPVKNLFILLEAFKRLQGKVGQLNQPFLVMVGDGPQREQIESIILKESIGNIVITGFLNQTQIISSYASSDILVLPSIREPWGLVVNEAMNQGCAILASNRLGCSPDLVISGVNGDIFDPESIDNLVMYMERLASDRDLLASYRKNSKAIINDWNLDACVKGIAQAAIFCAGK